MLNNGYRLDVANKTFVGVPKKSLGFTLAPLLEAMKEPNIQLQLRGISVVMKPPLWEVDAKGQLSSSGYYLSQFMQYAHAPDATVLLLPDFEYGFVHRLDVPSSGLILTGTHFEGYSLLQWQMHTYTIKREYSVLVCCLVPSTLCDINLPVHDFCPGQSFIDESLGRPAETHIKAMFHVVRWQQRWNTEYSCLVSIAIHTGRRHQIRVHMQWEGHPTVTDEKYSHRVLLATSVGLEIELKQRLAVAASCLASNCAS